jgi:hypothetical protein
VLLNHMVTAQKCERFLTLPMLGWDLMVGGPVSPVCALVYGFATTVASLFFLYPSMGLGVFGRRSPESIKAPLSPFANHLFFGVGMAIAVVIV